MLEGGGWCAGIDEPVSGLIDCYQRALNEDVGSSKTWQPYMNVGEYMSDDPTENPLASNWNLVYVKYCDGASFAGNNATTVTYNNLTLHFRGRRILDAVFEKIKGEYNFNTDTTTTDVLLSGCSAGGLATYIHSQRIYDTYINKRNTRFMVMPDAGYFFEYQGTNKFITGMQWVYQYQNVTNSLNEECIKYYSSFKNNSEWQCMFAQNIAPFILLPFPGLFALQSQYDSFQIKFELDTNTSDIVDINQYGMDFSKVVISNLINVSENRGAFYDSCSHHCSTSWSHANITINNQSAKNVASNRYYNQTVNTITNETNFYYQNKPYPCSTCGCPDNLNHSR